MLANSNRILRHRKLLECISYKVQDISYLHNCSVRRILNSKRIFNLSTDHRYSIINLKSVYGTRLISTNVENILNTADTVPSEPTEVITNTLFNSYTSSQSLQNSTANFSSVPDASHETAQPDGVLAEFPIPDAPLPPIKYPEIIDVLSPIADPPFEHLGLGGWTPVGMIQNGFEFLHCTVGLPWWGSILAATVIARTILFPAVVYTQRNSARMSNNMPKFQELQLKVNEAKQRGENIEAARFTQDLFAFMKEKKFNPLKSTLLPLIQAPVFISFFIGLREMANIPIKSMHNEGLFWFTDLTVPDQYYLLPLLMSLTMSATIELGADTGKMTTANHHLIKYILRFVPVVLFPFSMNFPGALLIYWVTSNIMSLMVAGLFKVKSVRKFFKVEDAIVDTKKLPVKNIGFVKGLKKWWKETKTKNALESRTKNHQISFTTAGRGAVPKTYKYNPTLPRNVQPSAMASIQAKKFG